MQQRLQFVYLASQFALQPFHAASLDGQEVRVAAQKGDCHV